MLHHGDLIPKHCIVGQSQGTVTLLTCNTGYNTNVKLNKLLGMISVLSKELTMYQLTNKLSGLFQKREPWT